MKKPDDELLRRYLAGQVSDDEQAAVHGYFESHPDELHVLEQLDSQLTELDVMVSDASDFGLIERGIQDAKRLIDPIVELKIPRRVGGYTLDEVVSIRDTATVCYGHDTVSGKQVVVKLLNPLGILDSVSLARFERELQALSSVADPHIVSLLDSGRQGNARFFVMERLRGCDLSQLIDHHGKLNEADVLSIARQVLPALQKIHSSGLVHRDIKPSNLFLTTEGTVKLLDFGIARESRAGTITSDASILGSVDYLAPEQALDSSRVDHRADQYGLGCTLYHLLAGHRPFQLLSNGNIVRTILAHAQTELPSVSTFRPDVSQQLSDIVERMCAKKPEDRWPDCDSILRALPTSVESGSLSKLAANCDQLAAARPVRFADEEHVDDRVKASLGFRFEWSVAVAICIVAILSISTLLPNLLQESGKEPNTLTGEAKSSLTNSVGMQFVWISPGEFDMGSSFTADELSKFAWDSHPRDYFKKDLPLHRVEVSKGFYLGTTEVTQKQWFDVMETTPWVGENKKQVKLGGKYPASYITWQDAVNFCERLSRLEGKRYRLPTEAEWEYACRADTTTRFSFGNASVVSNVWLIDNTRDGEQGYAQLVAQHPANAFGLYDMHGNVHEWCSDWFAEDYYSTSPTVDPTGPESGTHRIVRGGCFDNSEWWTTSFNRWRHPPESQWAINGFRVLLEAD